MRGHTVVCDYGFSSGIGLRGLDAPLRAAKDRNGGGAAT